MDILESLRYELRRRIVPGIVPVSDYQREGFDAPNSPLYIRETIIEASAEITMQNAETRRFLCEFDVFCDRKDLSPMAQLYALGAKIKAEFSPLENGAEVNLPGWTNVQAWIDAPPVYNAVAQEEDIFELPVIFYVSVIVGRGAEYGSN